MHKLQEHSFISFHLLIISLFELIFCHPTSCGHFNEVVATFNTLCFTTSKKLFAQNSSGSAAVLTFNLPLDVSVIPRVFLFIVFLELVE